MIGNPWVSFIPLDKELEKILQEEGTDGLKRWRKKYPTQKIRLAKAQLSGANLHGARLENAILREACLENARLSKAHLANADLQEAHLENAQLWEAHLENANLMFAHLENAKLFSTHLENVILREVNLANADLMGAHLENTKFVESDLENTNFKYVTVDGRTAFIDCQINKNTDFTIVGLGSCQISPHLRTQLEYNIRRKQWEERYRCSSVSRLWWPFWMISDYGRSTVRIIFWFFVFSLLYGGLYLIPTPAPDWMPECVQFKCEPFLTNLDSVEVLVDGETQTVPITGGTLLARAFYFSIVTMTTLGFGDIHANPFSFWGYFLLTTQVILGYVLLGAIITRLSILFQSLSAE